MLRWGKTSEGSDVRSKFELRREQVRRLVLGARRAASAQINAASVATVTSLRTAGGAVLAGARAGRGAATLGLQRTLNGLMATGSLVAGLAAAGGSTMLTGARAARRAAASAARRTLNRVSAAASIAGEKGRAASGAVAYVLAGPGVLAAAGALMLGAGIGRYRIAGFDGEVMVMLAVGGALMLILLVPLALPLLAGLSPLVGMAAVAIAMLTGAAFWAGYRNTPGLAGLGESKEVVGRATVVAGDLLKVAGTTVRLSGVEAPEREQRCGRENNKWRCAEAAQSALLKVVSGRSVRCRLSGRDKAGHQLGYCSIDSVDINADLVRQGYAFAEGGRHSPYAAQERDARDTKAGMWIGDAQRPAEFRAKAWEEAKRRAPDGCPIKGQVTGQERVYVLPGTPSYERLRVLTARGDRWFCSEQDAASAGFKAAQRS
jgi:endonuclease YncB( thermonuclease family)